MNSRLLVITGALGGTVLDVSDEVTIGRGSNCRLLIKEPAVSRLHCLITRDGDRFKIVDHSSYGTLVNGIPIKERFLVHGDWIEIGNSLLLFINEIEASHGAPAIEL